MKTLFRALSLLPLLLLHGLGWLLGWAVFATSRTYRQRLLANAAQAGYGWRIAAAAVGQAGMLLAELPRLWLGPPVAVRWDGAEHIDAALAGNAGSHDLPWDGPVAQHDARRTRGLLFLTPHLGSFEVTAQAYAARYGVGGAASVTGAQATHPPSPTLARPAVPMTVLYRPARKPWLRPLVDQSRQRPGLATAPASLAGVKQMLKALRQGHAVGLLPDQVPPLGQGVWAPFFGRDAYTMQLTARLAHSSGATVLIAWGQRLSWAGGYIVHVRPLLALLGQPLSADPLQAATQVNWAMQQVIARAPQQYLWAYARYKVPYAKPPAPDSAAALGVPPAELQP
jgi:Kdo2-lipid IVA lauroyltransferase/acyltransferase